MKISKNDLRTLKEKHEKRVYELFKKEFIDFYCRVLLNPYDVMFAFDKNLKDKYAYFEINQKYNSILIHINIRLVDENNNLIKLTAQRMALKIHLFKKGEDFSETSPVYLAYTKKYHIYNYGQLPETPRKWHVYTCSKCGINMAAYPKRLPIECDITKLKTPYHNKKLINEAEMDEFESGGGKVHQGTYSYSGIKELTNEELQKVLYIMKKSVEFTNNFTDNELKIVKKDDDDFDDFF